MTSDMAEIVIMVTTVYIAIIVTGIFLFQGR